MSTRKRKRSTTDSSSRKKLLGTCESDEHLQKRATDTLQKVWKHSTFRPKQLETILRLMKGESVMLVKPKGGGKSLVFQLPMLLLPEGQIGLVVSPLISLMKDQVESLQIKGIQAEFLSSQESQEVNADKLKNVHQGNVKILYVTPERLENWLSSNYFDKLPKIGIIAVDEAHCISQWGHSFRTSFRNLGRVRENLGNPPCLAATATATPRLQNDTMKMLQMEGAHISVESVVRDNITIRIVKQRFRNIKDKIDYIEEKLLNPNELSVIYAGSRDASDGVKEVLEDGELGMIGGNTQEDDTFVIQAYHGGLRPKERKRAQEKFSKATKGCLGATSAFGMGIDKANIRHVIHLRPTECLESYVQQIGRAGRDGKPAIATLFCGDKTDWNLANMFLETTWPDQNQVMLYFNFLVENQRDNWVRKKAKEIIIPGVKAASACRRILVELEIIRERKEWRFEITNFHQRDLHMMASKFSEFEKLVWDQLLALYHQHRQWIATLPQIDHNQENANDPFDRRFIVTRSQIFDRIDEEDLPLKRPPYEARDVTEALKNFQRSYLLTRKYDQTCKAMQIIDYNIEDKVLDYVDQTHREAEYRLRQMREFVDLGKSSKEYWEFIDNYFTRGGTNI